MKLLLTHIVLILLSINTLKAACTIDLYKKKLDAKTSYTLDGVSISKTIVTKLSSQCKFNIKLMSEEQKRKMAIARLKKKLVKLSEKKGK